MTLPRPLAGRRRAVALDGGGSLPAVVEAAEAGADPLAWLAAEGAAVEAALHGPGALLLRGFALPDAAAFRRFAGAALDGGLADYRYRSTPRREVEEGVYTATEYPPAAVIPLHGENHYRRSWPRRLAFCCLQPAAAGGATPLADTRALYRRLPADLRARFEAKGVLYLRRYGEIDLPWQEVFQTESRSELEAFCRAAGIDWTWDAEGRLETRQLCQASARHPVTGDWAWCNQAHLFHPAQHSPEVREGLRALYGPDGGPRGARYGDGTVIEDAVIEEILGHWAEETRRFAWRAGDLLLLDNLLTAHGRDPFEGPRRVLVAMSAEPCLPAEVRPALD